MLENDEPVDGIDPPAFWLIGLGLPPPPPEEDCEPPTRATTRLSAVGAAR